MGEVRVEYLCTIGNCTGTVNRTARGHVTVCDKGAKPLDKAPEVCHTISMENNKAMELSQLAAQGDAIDLAIAEAQGKVTVTRLATKKAPRQGVANRNRRAVTAEVNFAGVAVGKGRNGNLNKVGGIGAQMVSNPAAARANFERQIAEDRKAEARIRAAERAAEREAIALANLDSLLDQIQG